MKLTKLSLITVFAISGLYADGDTTPTPEPSAESSTTVDGKVVLYSITSDDQVDDGGNAIDILDGESTAAAASATLNLSQKIVDGISANFSAVGVVNLLGADTNPSYIDYFEGDKASGYLNVANLTGTYGGTSVVLGRQLLDTPMLGGYDWVMAPSAFQAYTLTNKPAEGLTLVASYVEKMRANNSGDTWTPISDGDAHNYALGAAFSNGFDANFWYYNIDALNYTQVYADAGYEVASLRFDGQYILTQYDVAPVATGITDDSMAVGVKASVELSGVSLMAAYTSVSDNVVGSANQADALFSKDGLYASSWNTLASTIQTDALKVEASAEVDSVSATVSYAQYDLTVPTGVTDDASELDVIVGYQAMENLKFDLVYTNTDYMDDTASDDTDEAAQAIEAVATYSF